MAIKPNKEAIVSDILIEIEKGISYSECLVLNGSKWFKPKTTFTRYWNLAQEQQRERQQAIKKQLQIDSTQAAQERLKKAILTKEERMEIASKIAKGEAWKVGATVIAPTAGDRIKAMDYLSKIEGDYAPIKGDFKIDEPVSNEILGSILEKLR